MMVDYYFCIYYNNMRAFWVYFRRHSLINGILTHILALLHVVLCILQYFVSNNTSLQNSKPIVYDCDQAYCAGLW